VLEQKKRIFNDLCEKTQIFEKFATSLDDCQGAALIYGSYIKISRLECPKGQFAYFRSFYASFWAV
jgi:hypothetical protein